MTLQRDPLSVRFDQHALDLLRVGYAHFGEWTDAYMPPPTPHQRRQWLTKGIDVDERDPWGEPNRWVRAYKRSCYHNLLRHGHPRGLNTRTVRTGRGYAVAMQWETIGQASRPGSRVQWWHFRIRLMPGGRAAQDAAAALPEDERFTANPAEWLHDR